MTNAIPPNSNGLRKKKGQTRIAHISDLHFSSRTDYEKEAVWTALALDLQSSEADLLVVTGDLIDSSVRDNIDEQGITNAFNNTKDFLLSLCKEDVLDIDPATRLAVVPGNHDYRVKGVLSPHSRYRPLERAKQRLLTPHYDLFYKHFGHYFEPRFHAELRCCVFTFDSNTADFGLNFASGRITDSDFVDFSTKCNEWSRENVDPSPDAHCRY
jgi:predicted phosphodiesterase